MSRDSSSSSTEVKSIEASQSILATFKFDGQEHNFKIDGRGPSILGSKQGDHVTAYSLIAKGFVRTLQSVDFNSEEGLADLKGKRGRIYEFISAIAALDEERREGFYKSVTKILEDYNKHRFKKTEIRALEDLAQALEATDSAKSKLLSAHIQQERLVNAQTIGNSLRDMAELTMTFYNKIPNTAYLQIKGFEAPSNEGASVNSALNFLEDVKAVGKKEFIKKIKELEAKKKKSSGKELEKVEYDLATMRLNDEFILTSTIKKLSDLFFYPHIKDDDALEKHQKETLDKTNANSRNNSSESLTSAIARHLYIAFAAYPEIEKKFGSDKIITRFTQNLIDKEWDIFKDESDKILKGVRKGVSSRKEENDQHLYSKTAAYDEVKSSAEASKDATRRGSEGDRKKGNDEKGEERKTNVDFQQKVVDGIPDQDLVAALQRRLGNKKDGDDKLFESLLGRMEEERQKNTPLDKAEKDLLFKALNGMEQYLVVNSKKRKAVNKEQFINTVNDELESLNIEFSKDQPIKGDNYLAII